MHIALSLCCQFYQFYCCEHSHALIKVSTWNAVHMAFAHELLVLSGHGCAILSVFLFCRFVK
jgi:hypothetical protein